MPRQPRLYVFTGKAGSKAEMQDLSSGRIGACFNVPQGACDPKNLHSHPHFELLYMIRGVREMEFNGRLFKARAGDLIVFKPGDEHVEFAGTACVSYFYLRFKPEELAGAKVSLPDALDASPVLALPGKGQFIDIFNRMLDEQASCSEDSRLLMNAYLLEFLVKLRRAMGETMGESYPGESVDSRILGAMEQIQRGIGGELDLERVAKRAFMSASHFSHAFKERFGESPKSYQVRKRVEMAKDMLRDSSMSAMEIAHELGYADPYFFYRQFKRKTGMTPSEFRKSFVVE